MSKKNDKPKDNPVVEQSVMEVELAKATEALNASLQAFAKSYDPEGNAADLNYVRRFNDRIGQVVGVLNGAEYEVRKIAGRPFPKSETEASKKE